MTLGLVQLRELAFRFVPPAAADERLYTSGKDSWWPAHELGHFLIATAEECRQIGFGIDDEPAHEPRFESPRWRYVMSREVAAMSVSQRLLRRSGHTKIANSESFYTDEWVTEVSIHESWCRLAVRDLLRSNRAHRLPTTVAGMESLLVRKAMEVGTKFYVSMNDALGVRSDHARARVLAAYAEAA